MNESFPKYMNHSSASTDGVVGPNGCGERDHLHVEPITVSVFQRKPRPGKNFSVELFMRSVVENMSARFRPNVRISRFHSNGVFRRSYNIVEAAFRQGDVNHVTGDVNFLTYLLRRDRTVLTILDCGAIVGEPSLRKRAIKLLWFDMPSRRCAAITVISHAVKEQLLELIDIDPAKIHVVPVAVPSIYRHVPRRFNEQKPTILQIGSAPNKNRTRLIQALSGLRCHLAMVGNASRAEIESLQRCGIEYSVHVNLSNEELFNKYIECDLVAFPSVFEGFGMPIIEANRVGRPVVAGNVASMPEVAGDAACLVDPFDVAAIREGILRIISDKDYRDRLISNGLENCKRYSEVEIARKYESLYLGLMDGRMPRAEGGLGSEAPGAPHV